MKFTTLFFATALMQVEAFLPAPRIYNTPSYLGASTTVTSSDSVLPTIREGVADLYDNTGEWECCVALLKEETNLPDEEGIEMALATALNWKGWAMSSAGMRKFIPKPHAPDLAKLESGLEWLKGEPLSLTAEQLATGILEYPRTYLVDPEATFKKSLSCAPDEYKDPAAFAALVLEDLQALGNTYNCANGGCASECGNCWVTYSKS